MAETQTAEQIHSAALEWLRDGHCPQELKMANGALNQQDADLIGQHIQSQHGGIWSVQTLNSTVSAIGTKLHWRSKAEVAYDTAYGKLTPEQAGIFGAWWQSSDAKNSIIRENDLGFDNAVKILAWMVGKQFSQSGFNLAVSNLVGTVGLHLAAARPQGEKRGHTMAPGETFMKKESSKPEYIGGKKNHACETNKPAQPTRENTPDTWQTLAENLKGATHSETAAIQNIHGRSWRETLSLRKAYLNRRAGSQFNPKAI
jgi:hypothetical protein